MDTRELHAQPEASLSRQIAAGVLPRVHLSGNGASPGPVVAPMLCIPPRFCEDRNACIERTAYFIAQRRGFSPGHELDDWLGAEREVDARLMGEYFWY
jgi:Protein of unknown function (DUF2934)